MFSLLFPSKRFEQQFRLIAKGMDAQNLRIEMLERVVSNQAATISRLTADLENAQSIKDPIRGKVPEKAASASRPGGLRSGVSSFRSGSSKSGSESRTQHYSSPVNTVTDDPTSSYHHSHGHHHHYSGGDTGGYDSGCSDSSSSFSGCD